MNIIVGVSDMKVINDAAAQLVTYSLGSCIGIAIHDPAARVGGILHFMLPESSLDPTRAQKNPSMFADTGIPFLFRSAYRLGAEKERLRVIVVGGAHFLDQLNFFNIGKRNYAAIKKIFRKNNVITDYEDVGGNVNRTLKLSVRNGEARVKVPGRGEKKI